MSAEGERETETERDWEGSRRAAVSRRRRVRTLGPWFKSLRYFRRMDNYAIADQLSLLSKLMDIHGENAFKSKSYASAAFSLEKLPQPVSDMPEAAIYKIRGIGESVGAKVIEIIKTGTLQPLQEYLAKTPAGVLEMMNIKGLGPKKIHTLWKEMSIDTIEDLKTACIENRIAQTKGFGDKTQQNILQSIEFQQQNSGRHLYAKLEAFAEAMTEKLKAKFPEERFELTGAFRRQMEIIESLDWVTTASSESLQKFLRTDSVELVTDRDGLLILNAENTILLRFHLATGEDFGSMLFATSSSEEFLNAWNSNHQAAGTAAEESEIFNKAGVNFIPAARREKPSIIEKAKAAQLEELVQVSDIKGLIHSHSNWSDGGHTIEEMAAALIELGFEYLVLSDHSKAAFYANGLSEQRIREQHRYIDTLNEKLAPFKIFKSIECDILNDGALDYENKILSGFDLVITSVHSNLDMDEEKAMKRLLGAITNPYTTIMGHLTGRLLLRRKGFPVDHEAIIEACAAHNVVIEINASPSRLDMDWRWVEKALDKGLTLSINPDAHTIDEFHNVRYGVLVGQKGGLTPARNLSSFSLKEFETWLQTTKQKKGIS